MDIETYQVDSFTNQAFKGNPAGVCITDSSLDSALMLSIADEMAVSETAFLNLENMNLKWFTPRLEVQLCGHGTLAAAHILKEKGLVKVGETLSFETLSGVLQVQVRDEDFKMDFPAPSINYEVDPDGDKLTALGLDESQVLAYGCFDGKELIQVQDERTLLSLQPNFEELSRMQGRGILVTALASSSELDFVSRYFAPWVGVNEDPVTGSAHCALAVHWQKTFQHTKLRGYQASRRGGYVDVELNSNGRVSLVGAAVTTLKGTLVV